MIVQKKKKKSINQHVIFIQGLGIMNK